MNEERMGVASKNSLGFINKIIQVLSEPQKFFNTIKSEEISKSIIYFAILNLVDVLVQFIAISFNIYSLLPKGVYTYTGVLEGYVGTIIGLFIITGIFHLFVHLFKGSGNYSHTLKAYIYGFTPAYLFGWVPYVGVLASIFGLYLFIKGLSVLHNFTMGKAFMVWLTPILILLVIALILFAIFGALLGGYILGRLGNLPIDPDMIKATGDFISTFKPS